MQKSTQDEARYVIGVMSGTSIDGIDIAACSFSEKGNKWFYSVHATETIPYDGVWREKLVRIPEVSAFGLMELHNSYGTLIGKSVADFCEKHDLDISKYFISSHGHTAFHRPDLGVTFQIGNGLHIAHASGVPVVCDFRTSDVLLMGQGAPLVPIGDKNLFSGYDAFLNIGGFANCSFYNENQLIAYDICPANIVLNQLMNSVGKLYDENGNMGKLGAVNVDLYNALNSLEFYKLPPPKSLGREWVEANISTLLASYEIKLEDKLRTFYEHIACQIHAALKNFNKILVTGGGAHNTFLMELLNRAQDKPYMVPNQECVDYKEAIVFAFLGVLKMLGRPNVLSSVTGAKYDHCSGFVFYPPNSQHSIVNK